MRSLRSNSNLFYYPLLFIFFNFIALICNQTLEAKLFTLKDIIQYSLKSSEDVTILTIKTEQLEEKRLENKSYLYPKISLGGSYGVSDLAANSKNRNVDRFPHFIKLTGTQTIYDGNKISAQEKIDQLMIEQSKELSKDKKVTLILAILNLYSSLVINHSDLKISNDQYQITLDRIKEIKERVQVGKSKKSDLLSAEAQKASLESQIIHLQSESRVIEQEILSVMGFPIDKLNEKHDFDLNFTLFENKKMNDQQLDLKFRPKIRALKLDYEAKEEEGGVLKSSYYLPTIELGGNYYVDKSGSPRPSMWDVAVSLKFSIYEGNITKYRMQENALAKREIETRLRLEERNFQEDWNKSIQKSLGMKMEKKSLAESLSKNKMAYEELQKDYRYGMATMLEVLQAQNLYVDAKKNLDHLNINYELEILYQKIISLQSSVLELI